MLKSGFSLKQSISNLIILYPELSNDLEKIYLDLEMGNDFSQSIKPYLNENTYNQIFIAERHGQLKLSIMQLGKYMQQRLKQREKIIGTLTYPVILLLLLILMLIIFFYWLKPTISSFSIENQSNLNEKIYVVSFEYLLLAIFVLFSVYLIKIFIWWKKQSCINRHIWYSQLPLVGKIYCYFSFYYLSFNLALLFRSGLNLQEICFFLKTFKSSSLIYQLGEMLNSHLQNGEEIAIFIDKYPFIPAELNVFMKKGHTNYQLSEDLLIYSQTIYQRLLNKINNLINLIQPISFLIIAIIIISVYLSILLPIYSNLGGIYNEN